MSKPDFIERARGFLGLKPADEPQSTYDLRVRLLTDLLAQMYEAGHRDGKDSGYRQAETAREAYDRGWDT